MAKRTKPQPKFIPENEREAAAKYFTLSNLAMEDYIKRNNNNIPWAYSVANADLEADTGVSAKEELDDWKNSIEKGDAYCFEEWEKYKAENPQVKW